MPIDVATALAAELEPIEFSWTSSDIQLYHLGLGAGADPMDAREALANLNRVSSTVGDPQQQDASRHLKGRQRDPHHLENQRSRCGKSHQHAGGDATSQPRHAQLDRRRILGRHGDKGRDRRDRIQNHEHRTERQQTVFADCHPIFRAANNSCFPKVLHCGLQLLKQGRVFACAYHARCGKKCHQHNLSGAQ